MPIKNQISLRLILIGGLIFGIVQLIAFLLADSLGYIALYTSPIFLLAFMFFKSTILNRLNLASNKLFCFLISLPIYLIGLLLFKMFWILNSNIEYTNFGLLNESVELLVRVVLYSAIFAFIFNPLLRFIKARN